MKQRFSFTAIGDCCVDVYPDHNKVFVGGTAFNTAFHAQQAGAVASIVSRVGSDAYGTLFFDAAKESHMNTSYLHHKKGKTSSVQIPLDEEGRPMFAGWELGVLKSFVLATEDAAFLRTQDSIKITYLNPLQPLFDSFLSIMQTLSCHPDKNHTSYFIIPNSLSKNAPFLVCDFAGGSQYSCSKEEVAKYAPLFDCFIRSVEPTDTEELALLKRIAEEHNNIAIASLGSQGSTVFTRDRVYSYPAIPTKVTDTTGAGDAYIAFFTIVYLQSNDIQKAMEEATKAAATTITHFGANMLD